MDTIYWVTEYISVLCGYVFLMFLWPSVVFGKHLRGRTVLYRLSFCSTAQVIVINAVILGLGFLRILNSCTVAGVFFGVFLVMLLIQAGQFCFRTAEDAVKQNRDLLYCVWMRLKERMWDLSDRIRGRFWESVLLGTLLAFGILYFSYGASRTHAYGYGELYTQHAWICELAEGTVFPMGIRSEAMQCFAVCMHMLFRIPVYSILLYLQCIHVTVFLLCAYFFLREVFHWRCTPLFVLAVYLVWDVKGADLIYSMARLQWTLPVEFGLYTVFLCPLYLLRRLRRREQEQMSGCGTGYPAVRPDRDLSLFLLSLAASLLIHVYAAVMAVLCSLPFLLSGMRKTEKRKGLRRLTAAVLCICLLALAVLAKGKVTDLYRYGYEGLYGSVCAKWIVFLSVSGILLGAAGRCRRIKAFYGEGDGYLPLVLAAVLFLLTYAMPYVGFLQLIPDSLFCSSGHLLVLSVLLIPADAAFYAAAARYGDRMIQRLSPVFVAGLCSSAVLTGNFHGYLFCERTRYDAAVAVTGSIVENFPKGSYVIIAPTDERYPVLGSGWHEELVTFAANIRREDYTLPQEYVFLYVEKKPLLYGQTWFFQGPSWLACEKYAEAYWEKYSHKNPYGALVKDARIISSEVSETAAGRELPEVKDRWEIYTRLDNRTVLESKVYEWCRHFMQKYPQELNVYYEDEQFVCYYLVQDLTDPYRLGMESYD